MSSFDQQHPFRPFTEKGSIYKPSMGWVGGSIFFPFHQSWTGKVPNATAQVDIAGSTLRGLMNLKVSENWVTEKGRYMERVISLDINPENVRAIHAALGKIIAGQESKS